MEFGRLPKDCWLSIGRDSILEGDDMDLACRYVGMSKICLELYIEECLSRAGT